jgi:hypothetical protein
MHGPIQIARLFIMKVNDGVQIGVLIVTRVVVECRHGNSGSAKIFSGLLDNPARFINLIKDIRRSPYIFSMA